MDTNYFTYLYIYIYIYVERERHAHTLHKEWLEMCAYILRCLPVNFHIMDELSMHQFIFFMHVFIKESVWQNLMSEL
jgi:hypothetical protein